VPSAPVTPDAGELLTGMNATPRGRVRTLRRTSRLPSLTPLSNGA
jgi:hypothetical protein